MDKEDIERVSPVNKTESRHKVVFATNNAHKLEEAREILGEGYIVFGLQDIGCQEDIPETGATLEENALIKARYVSEKYGYDCLADDTGLMVDALGGAPGIYSARYAGPGHDSEANISKLLAELEFKADRKAHFSTIIAYIEGEKEYLFEGRVDGKISESRRGEKGFGYDPIFIPVESGGMSFAEMEPGMKNSISHRGRAMREFKTFLNKRNEQ